MAPIRCSRVDLPDPDGPVTATAVPGLTRRSIASKAETWYPAAENVLVSPRSSTAAPFMWPPGGSFAAEDGYGGGPGQPDDRDGGGERDEQRAACRGEHGGGDRGHGHPGPQRRDRAEPGNRPGQ